MCKSCTHISITGDVEDFLRSTSRHDQLMQKATQSDKHTDTMNCMEKDSASKNGSDSVDEGISDRGSDSDIDFSRFKTMTLHLSRSDPSIYHSCQTVDRRRVSPLGWSSDERAKSHHTNTSPVSRPPTEGSVTFSIGDQDDVTDSVLGDSHSREPVEHGDSDSEQTSPPSPGERIVHDVGEKENWDLDSGDVTVLREEEPPKRFFRVVDEEMEILSNHRSELLLHCTDLRTHIQV